MPSSTLDVKEVLTGLDAARRQAAEIYGDPEHRFTIRALRKSDEHTRDLEGPVGGLWPEVQRLQADSYDIYFLLNNRGGAAFHDSEVVAAGGDIPALCADFDDKPLPKRWHQSPAIGVGRNSMRNQVWWPLEPGLPVADFKPWQRGLANLYDSDKKVVNPARLFRLAGTVNAQTKEPYALTVMPGTRMAPSIATIGVTKASAALGEGGPATAWAAHVPVEQHNAVHVLARFVCHLQAAEELKEGNRDNGTYALVHTAREMGLDDRELIRDAMAAHLKIESWPGDQTAFLEAKINSAFGKTDASLCGCDYVGPLNETYAAHLQAYVAEHAAETRKAEVDALLAKNAVPAGYFGDLWADTPAPMFPLDGLPPALRAFVERKAQSTGCDPAGFAVAALVAASGVIDRRSRIRMKRRDSYEQFSHLWGNLVGDVSAGKGPITSAVTAPVKRLDAENAALQAERDRTAAARKRQKEHEFKTKMALIGGVEDFLEPEEDVYPIHIFSDITKEAMNAELAESDCGKLGVYTEMTSWIGGMDAYKPTGKAGGERGFWCAVFDGGQGAAVRRVSRARTSAANIGASMLTGVQPDMLRTMGDLTSDGVLQRFLVVPLLPKGPEADISCAAVNEGWDRLIRGLAQAPPAHLEFTDDGYDIRDELNADITRLSARMSLNKQFRGHAGKLEQYFGRLALVLHQLWLIPAYGYADPGQAGYKVVSAALAQYVDRLIRNYFLPAAETFFDSLSGQEHGDAIRNLGSFVLTDGRSRMTMHDLEAGSRAVRQLKDRREKHGLIDRLVLLNWLQPVWGTRLDYPASYVVHPALRSTLAARRSQLIAEKAPIIAKMRTPEAWSSKPAKGGALAKTYAHVLDETSPAWSV